MGCCGSATDDPNAAITRMQRDQARQQQAISKLLLLGTGASGKSTIFKNLRQNNGDNVFDERTMEEAANTLRSSLVQFMMRILLAATQFEEDGDVRYKDCTPDMEDEDVRNNVQEFMRVYCLLTHTPMEDLRRHPPAEVDMTDHLEVFGETLGKTIANLWGQSWVRATYKNRGGHFSMPDNMKVFFPRAIEILADSYKPSHDDMLRTRVRTTGVIQYTYSYEDTVFTVIDVGGQRNERAKWRKQFEMADVNALLFVAALNHYNEVLFEDENVNAMHEAVRIWADYINDDSFKDSNIILFLNKVDLFDEAIQEFPLGVCFGPRETTGWKGPEIWEGPDFVPMPGVVIDAGAPEPDFNECRAAALAFIKDVFQKRNQMDGRRIYKHVTCATSPDNVKEVFWDVQNIVIKDNLVKSGLMTQ